VPADFRCPLGSWSGKMRISKSAVRSRAFSDGTATGADADLKHRAPLGPCLKGDLELSRVKTDGFLPPRCDWSPLPTSNEPAPPARDELCSISDGATSPSPYLSGIHPATILHGFNRKDRAGWSNEGREVLGAWLMVLLGVALAVLLLASHQPNASDLRLPQWSDPPVAGAEDWTDDPSAGRNGNLAPASDENTTP
jgi:hypothetical protein